MKGLLIVNPRSGPGGPGLEELVAESRRLRIETHVLRPGDDAAEIARGSEAEALGMAGGDGSLAPVAEVALDRRVPFVASPSGRVTTSRATSDSTAITRLPRCVPSTAASAASTSGARTSACS